MAGEFVPISAAARRTLEHELAGLQAERQKVAASLPPQDEDDRLAESLRLEPLDAQIAEVQAWLHWAPDAGPDTAEDITIGSVVTVRPAGDRERTISLSVTTGTTDPLAVTVKSPLGAAVLGHRAGDTVTYGTENGQRTATIISVQHPPAVP